MVQNMQRDGAGIGEAEQTDRNLKKEREVVDDKQRLRQEKVKWNTHLCGKWCKRTQYKNELDCIFPLRCCSPSMFNVF